jgi:hypothetical protein
MQNAAKTASPLTMDNISSPSDIGYLPHPHRPIRQGRSFSPGQQWRKRSSPGPRIPYRARRVGSTERSSLSLISTRWRKLTANWRTETRSDSWRGAIGMQTRALAYRCLPGHDVNSFSHSNRPRLARIAARVVGATLVINPSSH